MAKRGVHIAGASGGFSDRTRAIRDLARNDGVDVIVGDWLSEMTMTIHGTTKVRNQLRRRGNQSDPSGPPSWADQLADATFAENFVDCLLPDGLAEIGARNKAGSGRPPVKLAVNAGASDTAVLAKLVKREAARLGHGHLKVAWVEGDDVTGVVKAMLDAGQDPFRSLMHGRSVAEWGLEPVCAQCYLGGLGIARALAEGADIVICGRVSDASPIIGAAAWWHGWSPADFDRLASALVIGHLLECSAYVTGGYFSDFKALLAAGKHINLGFPICEVLPDGSGIMRKEPDTGGTVSVGSLTSQLVYEIQGPYYYNCDVTADLRTVQFEQVAEDEVRIFGVKGLPPPPTTKVGITGFAGYQAEYHVYFCGLDVAEKCRWTEDQIRHELGPDTVSKFTVLKFMQNGSSAPDAPNQDVATVDFRIFAQTRDRELLSMRNPAGFFRKSMVTFLQSAPGASLGNDMRLAEGKPYYEYHPALLPQAAVRQRVHLLWGGGGNDDDDDDDNNLPAPIDIPLAPEFKTYPPQQPSASATASPADLASFGPTTRLPLGRVVLGRSGDKCSDCNVGFFVRHPDEWDWLRSFLSVNALRTLMGPEESAKCARIDRVEFPLVRAVHFLLHDHLDRGYDACSTYDTLGKNFCEYIRARVVDVPVKFADRGTV